MNRTSALCIGVFVVLLFCFTEVGLSQSRVPVREYHGQTVWDLPSTAEEEIDVGLWALVGAKEFNPKVDVAWYSSQLDSSVAEIRRMLANRSSDKDKFAATRMFIYDAGVWNAQQSFEYDLADPLGSDLSHQLLSFYLDSRKGNCVSMPTMFNALMQRLDPSISVSAVNAPLHLFCRFKDRQTGDEWNLECTNGTTARNVWYLESMNIPKKVIESGIYMRRLSKKEFLAELISILVHQRRVKGNFPVALKYADLALKLDSISITNLISKCALYAELGHSLHDKKARGDILTAAELSTLDECMEKSRAYERKAQSLGWRPETPEERAKYLRTVKEEKAKRNHH